MSNLTKLGLKTRVGTLAVGTAWARVEADVHYPSDVLTGLALGHFIAAFFNEAFLMPKKNDHFCFGAQTSIDKIVLTFYWAF